MLNIRKIILVLLAILLATFVTGCALKKQSVKPQNRAIHAAGFDTTAEIKYKTLSATAKISQETPAQCTVAFSSPESLEGLSFAFHENGVDMAYRGLMFTFDPDSVPGTAAASMAVRAINAVMRDQGVELRSDGSFIELQGTMDSGEFLLRVDAESGNLLKLSVPDEDFEIVFGGFTFLG